MHKTGNDVLIANEASEAIDGLAGDDLIIGLGNGNTISGSDGDDAIISAGGSNLIDGGAGDDTVVYTGVKADYTLATTDNGAMSVTSEKGSDIVMNVESLSFQDGSVAVSTAVTIPDVPETPVEETPVEETPG